MKSNMHDFFYPPIHKLLKKILSQGETKLLKNCWIRFDA